MYVPCLNCGSEYDGNVYSVYCFTWAQPKWEARQKKKRLKKNPRKYLDTYLFHFMTGILSFYGEMEEKTGENVQVFDEIEMIDIILLI